MTKRRAMLSVFTLAVAVATAVTAVAQEPPPPPPPPPMPGMPPIPGMPGPVRAPAGAPGSLAFGIFAPNEPWGGVTLEQRYIERMASHVAIVTGIVSFTGKAYTDEKAFTAALSGGQIQVAVVDPVYLAAHPELKVLAQGAVDGKPGRTWALYAKSATTGVALRGKTLAAPEVAGLEAGFLSNALLDGEMDVTRWFAGKPVAAGDVGAAAGLVAAGGADAVFCPPEGVKGLVKVFDTDTVPMAGLVQVDGRLSGPTVAAVTKAVLGWSGEPPIGSWVASDGSPYRALRARMAPRNKLPAMAAPDTLVPPSLGSSMLAAKPATFGDFGAPEDFYWRPNPVEVANATPTSLPASQPTATPEAKTPPATPAKPAPTSPGTPRHRTGASAKH